MRRWPAGDERREATRDEGGRLKRKITALTALGMALMGSNVAIQGLMAVFLGAGAERDALFVAMSVPLFLNTLMIASFGAVITPAVLEHRQNARQRAVAGRMAVAIGLAAGLAAVALQFCRGGLVQLLAPGFGPAEHAYTAGLFSITLAMVPLQAVTCVLGGYWIARERVLFPNVASLAGNATVVGALIWSGGASTGVRVAWYSLLGVLLTAVLQGVMFWLEKREPAGPPVPAAGPSRSPYANALPLLASTLVGRSAPLIERNLASGMGAGTISCLGYAAYLVNFLVNATATPTATAYYAQMCRQWSEGRREELTRFLERGTIFVVLASLTVAGVLVLGSHDLLQALQPYTRFSRADMVELSDYTAILMVAYVSMSFGSFIARIFYASGQFLHAALLDCAAVVFYLLLAVPLGRAWGGYGLVAATCAQMVFLAGLILHGVWRRLGVTLPRRLWAGLGKAGLGWACGLGLGILVHAQMQPLLPPLAGAALGIGVYVVSLIVVAMRTLPGLGVDWRSLVRRKMMAAPSLT